MHGERLSVFVCVCVRVWGALAPAAGEWARKQSAPRWRGLRPRKPSPPPAVLRRAPLRAPQVTALLKAKGIDLDNNRFLILQARPPAPRHPPRRPAGRPLGRPPAGVWGFRGCQGPGAGA
jgi:hypothetical protein